VVRPKSRRIQHYPLVRPVGDAIVRYLRDVRPSCPFRELFLALSAPLRPLSAASVTPIVHSRLVALGVQLPRRGPHSLRHACARQLLSHGFSLKQIGDQLGHRRASTTLHYAKIDMDGLRQVAELDLGRLV
jgi:site-specific recombinase XerD